MSRFSLLERALSAHLPTSSVLVIIPPNASILTSLDIPSVLNAGL